MHRKGLEGKGEIGDARGKRGKGRIRGEKVII